MKSLQKLSFILRIMLVCLPVIAMLSCTQSDISSKKDKKGPWPKEYLSWSKKQIDDQRIKGEKLLSDFESALKRGDKSFVIEPGTYRVSKGFYFTDITDFTLDGQNSLILFDVDTSLKGGFDIARCNNLSIKNMRVDWTKVFYTQGLIQSVDRESHSVLYKPDEGYDDLYNDHRYGLGKNIRGDGAEGTWRIFTFDEKGDFAPFQVRNSARAFNPDEKPFAKADSNGRYRLVITPPNTKWYGPDQQGLTPGTKVAISSRQGTDLFTLSDCGPVTIENITCHGTPYRVVVSWGGEGPLTIRNLQNFRHPETDRLLTSGADAILVLAMNKGPVVENCKLEGITDDFFNVGGINYLVYAQTGPSEFLVRTFPLNGDTVPVLRFLTLGDWKFYKENKIRKISGIENYIVPKGWGKEYTPPRRADGITPGDTVKVFRITLENPMTLPAKGLFFSSESAVCRGLTVRNCDLRRNMARGFLIHSRDVLIENNYLYNSLESAFILASEPTFWGECYSARNVTLRNNTIMETNRRAISFPTIYQKIHYSGAIVMGVEHDPLTTGEWVDGVTIENNTIIRPGGSAVSIQGARNITISGNTFEECGNLPWHGRGRQPEKYGIPVAVYAGENIIEKNNIVRFAGLYSLDQ
jgi:hypothetical protein